MVDKDGNAVLLDFGLSRQRFETTRTLTNIQASGSLRFLAPELSIGEGDFRTTEKSDTYSFGMLIYQLLYDTVPFDNIVKDYLVPTQVAAGRTPRRPKLPDDRCTLAAWRKIEKNLWLTIQATWIEQDKRTELKTVHITV